MSIQQLLEQRLYENKNQQWVYHATEKGKKPKVYHNHKQMGLHVAKEKEPSLIIAGVIRSEGKDFSLWDINANIGNTIEAEDAGYWDVKSTIDAILNKNPDKELKKHNLNKGSLLKINTQKQLIEYLKENGINSIEYYNEDENVGSDPTSFIILTNDQILETVDITEELEQEDYDIIEYGETL